MSAVRVGSRTVGDGAPVFVTFEAGATHDGPATARRLVDHAAAAGADAVKFQIVDPDRMVADRELAFSYEVLADRATGARETVTEPLYDILSRRTLGLEDWRALKRHADGAGLAFFATVSFDDDVDLLQEIGADSIKIASADVNHLPLIRRAAASGLSIQLDTGSATLGEIETAVDAVRAEGNDQLIIHHCPSGYPARLEGINLRLITTLRQMFPHPVGFSDHTPGRDMDIAAVALGANLVEKTITEDRATRSVEHIMSLEPGEMAAFVEAVHATETALGDTRRVLHDAERERRRGLRRSVHLARDARAGERLAELAVDYRRPGDGIAPDVFEQLGGARLACDLPAGTRLSLGHLDRE